MKLYVIVDTALSSGLKAAQGIHAAFQFAQDFPHLWNYWFFESNNIVVLEHDDVPALKTQLESQGVRLSPFYEPDLDGKMTAICAEPCARPSLSKLKLAK